jgi:hypothetical protein
MPKFTRGLSFWTALDQKLVAIARGFGSASEGARQCKITLRTFNRWRARTAYPTKGMFSNVDDAYAMAIEILNDPELMKKRKETTRTIRGLATKLRLSHNTVRLLQAEGLY